MLLEDGSQGNMDPEAAATVKEEEGSSNTGCSVCGDAARSLRLRWCSFQVVAMLLKDGNRENMDREATATVEEEEGSRNACYGCSVWLRQREEEVEEGTIVAKEGNNGMADAGIAWKEQCKRSLLAMTTEDGCEISLLAALYNERSLLVVIKSLLATIKVDGDVVGPRREFTRRFAEGIRKLARNTLGDHRKKTRRLAARLPEVARLAGVRS
ncbi:hypothetical protein BHM03_00042127 [Ensete ventricosum]|nr:hypothetical protein BHM03_00042127 [Ensete ventricosum]